MIRNSGVPNLLGHPVENSGQVRRKENIQKVMMIAQNNAILLKKNR